MKKYLAAWSLVILQPLGSSAMAKCTDLYGPLIEKRQVEIGKFNDMCRRAILTGATATGTTWGAAGGPVGAIAGTVLGAAAGGLIVIGTTSWGCVGADINENVPRSKALSILQSAESGDQSLIFRAFTAHVRSRVASDLSMDQIRSVMNSINVDGAACVDYNGQPASDVRNLATVRELVDLFISRAPAIPSPVR